MFLPQFIMNYEVNINRELTLKGLEVQFHITDYNPDTKAVFYSLVGKNPTETVPKAAEIIVEEYLKDLRQFLIMTNRDLFSRAQP
jgi:hypothetical protein